MSDDEGLRVMRRDGEKQVLQVTKVTRGMEGRPHARIEVIVRDEDLDKLLTPLDEANPWQNESVNMDELEAELKQKLVATVVMPEDDEEFERTFRTQAEVDAYETGLGDASSRYFVDRVHKEIVVDATIEKKPKQLKEAN